jgi:hypothetical protein
MILDLGLRIADLKETGGLYNVDAQSFARGAKGLRVYQNITGCCSL